MPASAKQRAATSPIPTDAPVAQSGTTRELTAAVPVPDQTKAPTASTNPMEPPAEASSSTAQQINPVVTVDDNVTSPDESDSAYGGDDLLKHPGAEITGVDLSPIQPSFTPPNCKFEIDDVTSPWTYPSSHFDFVNIRGLYGSISDWPGLYAQAFNHLQAGGYIHQLEMSIQFKSDDGTLTPDHVLSQWSDVFHEASKRFGKSFFEVWNLSTYIKNTGFTDVVEQIYKVPVNGWPADPHMKELGRWNFLHCTQGAEGWGLMLLTKVIGLEY